MARSLFVLLLGFSTLLLLTPAWLLQAEAATQIIPWDLNWTKRVHLPQISIGDDLVFKWVDLAWHDLWIMDDEKAFKACDFQRAKRLRPLVVGGQYTYTVRDSGSYYFASSGLLQCNYYKVKISFKLLAPP
ncbi:unnamed protein product [Closterium sp. Yama58-4]|nr:unnamed protein product [Closterium sp. Yama58-4]